MELSDKLKVTGLTLLASTLITTQSYAMKLSEKYCSTCPPILSTWKPLGEKTINSRTYKGHDTGGGQLIHQIQDGQVTKYWFISNNSDAGFGVSVNGTDRTYIYEGLKRWHELGD